MVDPRGLEVAADWRTLESPETYTGYRQSTGFAQEDVASFDEPATYPVPPRLALNSWGLSGNWTVTSHAAVSNTPGGCMVFQFHARDLNLVMGPASRGAAISFQIFLDGQAAEGAYGIDVNADGRGIVGEQRTYQLIRQSGPIASRRFEIEFADAGVGVYCFTFG
jgi:Thioredoxin like C-terminal domain